MLFSIQKGKESLRGVAVSMCCARFYVSSFCGCAVSKFLVLRTFGLRRAKG